MLIFSFLNAFHLIGFGEDGDSGGGEGGGDGDAGGAGGGDGGPGVDSSGGEFSWSSWDGNADSLGESQREAYNRIQELNSAKAKSDAASAISENLRRRYQESERNRVLKERSRAESNRSESKEGESDLDIEARLRKYESDRVNREKIEAFRAGMLSLSEKPSQFGDASIAFTSQDDFDKFERFIGEKYKSFTAEDFLKLYRFEEIIAGNKSAAVSAHDKKLLSRRNSIASKTGGKDAGTKAANEKGDFNPHGEGRVPSFEEFLRRSNPDAYEKITSKDR